MNEKTTIERLNLLFCELFDDDSIVITLDTAAADIDGWDSIMQIHLLTAIESDFHIKFSIHEVIEFQNVGDIIHAIQSK